MFDTCPVAGAGAVGAALADTADAVKAIAPTKIRADLRM